MIVAAIVALIGAVAIWTLVPYNNFWLDNSFVADSFLPEAVVGLMVLLVLVVNPLLWLIGPRWMLNRRQIALIGSLLLFAVVLPSNGLMRFYPHFVAEINETMHTSPRTAEIAAEAEFPQQLFPDPLPEKTADGEVKTFETPVSSQFTDELAPGESIPWSAWIQPMAIWGMLIIALWMMMLGLGGVVYPQWRDRERLPFPLLNVYHAFMHEPEERSDHVLPAIFRSWGFWTAVGVVFLIHGLRGLNEFTSAFPSVPLDWNLSPYYKDSFMQSAPLPLKRQSILFAIIGVAYFIPTRYAVSVWGWVVIYSIYQMFGRAYVPAFNDGQINPQSFGALLAIVLWTLWLGRSHWRTVGRAMLGRSKEGTADERRRDAIAGWMFAIGCGALVCWLYWAGCSLWWSLLATAGAAMISLLMARIVAETGVPVLWMGRFQLNHLTSFFPLAWLSPTILLFTGVLYATVTRASAVSAAVMSTHALGMDREGSPKHQARLLGGGLLIMIIGLVVCGAIHLDMGYSSAEIATDPKTSATRINEWARADRQDFQFFTAERGHQAVGFGIGSGLLWLCSRFPSWPLHPVGMIFCRWSIGFLLWFSIFLGWLIKVGVTSLAGGAAYRKARPIFLGLIIGELVAAIFWALVPLGIVLWTGADPTDVTRYIIIKYP